MKFGVYFPERTTSSGSFKFPLIYCLGGSRSSEQFFVSSTGAQKHAAEYGVALVMPDVSPRGIVNKDDNPAERIGPGNGFYIDTTQEPWKENYQMFSYITQELPALLTENFGDVLDMSRCSILGHSMGGHGALICSLKLPGKYMCCTALSPVCHASATGTLTKMFTLYLGTDKTAWEAYDATVLIKQYKGPNLHVIIDQGTDDEYLEDLMIQEFTDTCQSVGFPVQVRWREGYDHSSFFVATFLGEHIAHHARILKS